MQPETVQPPNLSLEGVLDAGTVLASIQGEPGRALADEVIPNSVILSVNFGEVATVLVRNGVPFESASQLLRSLGLTVVPYDAELALLAAKLYPDGKPFGLSLGDRACLALAVQRDLPVFTTERKWSELKLPISVRVIR